MRRTLCMILALIIFCPVLVSCDKNGKDAGSKRTFGSETEIIFNDETTDTTAAYIEIDVTSTEYETDAPIESWTHATSRADRTTAPTASVSTTRSQNRITVIPGSVTTTQPTRVTYAPTVITVIPASGTASAETIRPTEAAKTTSVITVIPSASADRQTYTTKPATGTTSQNVQPSQTEKTPATTSAPVIIYPPVPVPTYHVTCGKCLGKGRCTCTVCGGRGYDYTKTEFVPSLTDKPSQTIVHYHTCPTCRGGGTIICPYCQGKGYY